MKKFNEIFYSVNYPSGEWHLKLNQWPWQNEDIVANIVDFNGLAMCVVGNRILKRNDIEVNWIIPFFPFAREDRRNSREDGMELDLALSLVKELNASVIDPHSEVTAAGVKFYPQDDVVREFAYAGLFEGDPVIAIPDAGAAKKAYSWIAEHNLPYVQCLKRRDPETGKLDGFQVIPNNVDLRNKDIVIVDDICDGGGTFLGLANELLAYTHPPASMRLAVTHGLFTKGCFELSKCFNKIYSLDTPSLDPDRDLYVRTVDVGSLITNGRAR